MTRVSARNTGRRQSEPWMPFYVDDFLNDDGIQLSSLATVGLWTQMLCRMWKRPVRGVLTDSIDDLARLSGANGHGIAENVSHTVDQAQGQAIAARSTVRRLTPRECERLQGFPDDYTLIDWSGKRKWFDYFDTVRYIMASGFSMTEAAHLARTPDGNRYRAIVNSMAVPVIRWIGERIALVDSIC